MGQILTTPTRLPCTRQAVTLGEERYTLRLTWRDRCQAWYADLWTADGAPVWLGQRVTPQWGLGLGLTAEGAPDGILHVRGPADYERTDLGGAVRLVFYPTEELPGATASDDELTITLT